MKAKFTMASGQVVTVDATPEIREQIREEINTAESIQFHEGDWRLILMTGRIESVEFIRTHG